RQGEGPDLTRPRVVHQARLPAHDRRDQEGRVAEGLQGSDGEVRVAGEALAGWEVDVELRGGTAVPERGYQGSAVRHQGYVQLRLRLRERSRRHRPAELRR